MITDFLTDDDRRQLAMLAPRLREVLESPVIRKWLEVQRLSMTASLGEINFRTDDGLAEAERLQFINASLNMIVEGLTGAMQRGENIFDEIQEIQNRQKRTEKRQ